METFMIGIVLWKWRASDPDLIVTVTCSHCFTQTTQNNYNYIEIIYIRKLAIFVAVSMFLDVKHQNIGGCIVKINK
ncbi:hypothetical protein T11_8776 [Trichinella zimbabwensis]|uniref:Uncharacterized protein n=1 Tax=Trichinella zimbabwensis TaxID=268475 RepID=A0A0V1I5C2_9BILA|nr:hypothetical protein T11_8776 [Trichinella zimbabwensis]